MDSSLGILNIDVNSLKSHKRFNIKIINIILKVLNKCVPIELIDSIISKRKYLKSTRMTDKEKNNLKIILLKNLRII